MCYNKSTEKGELINSNEKTEKRNFLQMNIMVFDTETVSVNKPFCYNIGYVIYNTDTDEMLVKKDFVVEQIWHNMPLFSTAYYADKRPIYVNRMRAKKTKMNKFGYICKEMIKDLNTFNVEYAYAYNSSFDEKVFEYNCDYFKCNNPFDTVPILDIRGNVHNSIAFTQNFKNFCEEHNRFTEKGNYSTTAETIYQYITGIFDFEEEHTALADSIIELSILMFTINVHDLVYGKEYKTYTSIPRTTEKVLTVTDTDGLKHEFVYNKKTIRDDGNHIILKNV